MIKFFLIIAFSLFLSGNTLAQSSAVMRVSVTVVSGVSAEKNNDFVLSLNPTHNSKGEIVFTSNPYVDVDITTEQDLTIKNTDGDKLSLKTDTLIKSDNKLGKHTVSIGSNSIQLDQANTDYKGSIRATINYL